MNKQTEIEKELAQLPILEYAFLKPSEIIFSKEVRDLCEGNSCGMYHKSWACPPAVGSVESCMEKCQGYDQAMLFTTATEMASSFDMKGWMRAREEHEALTDQVAAVFRSYDKDALILSTEGCTVCKKCSYPDAPCRFPDRMYPATEGYGIMVMQMAPALNIRYNNGANTVTYFSMVLYNE
jgi:predicted metal-binding protein